MLFNSYNFVDNSKMFFSLNKKKKKKMLIQRFRLLLKNVNNSVKIKELYREMTRWRRVNTISLCILGL